MAVALLAGERGAHGRRLLGQQLSQRLGARAWLLRLTLAIPLGKHRPHQPQDGTGAVEAAPTSVLSVTSLFSHSSGSLRRTFRRCCLVQERHQRRAAATPANSPHPPRLAYKYGHVSWDHKSTIKDVYTICYNETFVHTDNQLSAATDPYNFTNDEVVREWTENGWK